MGRSRLEEIMALVDQTRREAGLAVKFALVGWLGLAVDVALLKLGLAAGLAPSIARLISLALAMQLTFVVNGLLVFRCLEMRALPRQWACYMGSNGVGNVCNYWIFLGLIASGLPVVSNKLPALAIGAMVAWAINFLGARHIAFGEK
jgi:putative flippase GtrA